MLIPNVAEVIRLFVKKKFENIFVDTYKFKSCQSSFFLSVTIYRKSNCIMFMYIGSSFYFFKPPHL